jgi:nicotinamide-nucleotide amidase
VAAHHDSFEGVFMTAEILTIGDELLIGQVTNTNQAYIAEQLTANGVTVDRMTTVGDDENAVRAAFADSWKRSDLVIATGGLGPTHDDITKRAACGFFQCGLVSNPVVRRNIEALLQRRNARWSEAAESQTLIPEKAAILPNPVGTAPGLLFSEAGKCMIILPGVPYEMKEIVDGSVLPFLRQQGNRIALRQMTLRTTGITESLLSAKLGNLQELLEEASLAFLPSPTGVRLRVTVRNPDPAAADELLARTVERIRTKVDPFIYGEENEEIEEIIGRLLTTQHRTLAVAESCTGGMIANRITNVSGSSIYFQRGLVTYSNAAKTDLLDVPPELFARRGAVSREVAEAMASGVRRRAGVDIGLSTTGIAGPTGGTPDKPVGTVWVGYADGEELLAVPFLFADARLRFKERASQAALELLRRKMLRIDGRP